MTRLVSHALLTALLVVGFVLAVTFMPREIPTAADGTGPSDCAGTSTELCEDLSGLAGLVVVEP